jgi:hypothetical protein
VDWKQYLVYENYNLNIVQNLALNKLTSFLDLSTCEGENFC